MTKTRRGNPRRVKLSTECRQLESKNENFRKKKFPFLRVSAIRIYHLKQSVPIIILKYFVPNLDCAFIKPY